MNILLTGATGWVGQKLGLELVRRGHHLICPVRNSQRAQQICSFPAEWEIWEDYRKPLQVRTKTQIDAVINLMGEPIAGNRWSKKIKDEIYNSRVISSQNLGRFIKEKNIQHFISASAVGYYGDRGDESLNESSLAGNGFLSDVCSSWEKAIFASSTYARCVALRIGVVFGKDGGALPKMIAPYKWGGGGRLGSGQQWISWIHIDDLINLFIFCLENFKIFGAVNAVSPKPIRQSDLSSILAYEINKPAFMWVPKIVLKTILGEMSDIVLNSCKVIPEVALNSKFSFCYSQADLALSNILQDKTY